jgi:two-component system catabolic regulation response regulator CreB
VARVPRTVPSVCPSRYSRLASFIFPFMDKPKILIVDDESLFLKTIRVGLEQEFLQVITAETGSAALAALEQHPDLSLALVDIGLPDMSGYDLFRLMRAISDVPVMFLTSRTAEMDEVRGLELGADGYLKKPISPTTVAAHVKAILRRSATAAAPTAKSGAKTAREEDDEEAEFEIKDQPQPDLIIDDKAKAIYYKGIELDLTSHQFIILSKLVQHPRRVFQPDMILDWINPDGTATEHSVYNHMRRIRKSIERAAPKGMFIINHHNDGYSLI